jgi:hypothetical protein
MVVAFAADRWYASCDLFYVAVGILHVSRDEVAAAGNKSYTHLQELQDNTQKSQASPAASAQTDIKGDHIL